MLRKFSDLLAFRRDPLALLGARGEGGEPLAPLNLGLRPLYLVTDPRVARDVLRAEEADIDKGRHVHKLCSVVGLNSITMSGDAQRARRAVLHQAFMAGMAGDYAARIGALVRNWAAGLARETTIEAHGTTAHLTLRVICAVLFGPDALSPGDEALLIQAVRLVEDDLAEDMFRALPPMPWTALAKRRKIARAREMMALVVGRTCGRASSSSLLRALQGLDLDGDALRDEVLILLLAGHHTTGAAAAWLLYFLASDPALAREIADEAARLSDAGGELTPLALRSASRSRALVFEVLRLYPSTYWMARDLQRDQEIAGRRLRKGTSLIISQWHLHRDPRFWPEPETLRLDRSWTANPAYMPFGFGPRACTGMSVASTKLQLIALEFALSFEARVLSALPSPPPRASVTLKPPPIRIGLRGRDADLPVEVREVAA